MAHCLMVLRDRVSRSNSSLGVSMGNARKRSPGGGLCRIMSGPLLGCGGAADFGADRMGNYLDAIMHCYACWSCGLPVSCNIAPRGHNNLSALADASSRGWRLMRLVIGNLLPYGPSGRQGRESLCRLVTAISRTKYLFPVAVPCRCLRRRCRMRAFDRADVTYHLRGSTAPGMVKTAHPATRRSCSAYHCGIN
jgi:hypothetical protein